MNLHLPSPRRGRRPLQRGDRSTFSLIKTFVTSSFGWTNDSDAVCGDSADPLDTDSDLSGKRRRGVSEQENRQPKRLRVGSPQREPATLYNVSQYPPPEFPPKPSRLSQAVGGLSLAERTASPAPREPTLPPNSYLQRSRDSQLRDSQLRSESVVRESTQPIEAPSVQALQEKPSFVRPSSHASDLFPARSVSRQPPATTTLELLAQSKRRTQSPRLHSALVFEPPRESPDPGMTSFSAQRCVTHLCPPALRPVPNAASRALDGLDEYKRPMPSRTMSSAEAQKEYLNGSQSFGVVRKKPLTMISDEERKLQNLGRSKAKSHETVATQYSPYGGQSNTQKRLRKSLNTDEQPPPELTSSVPAIPVLPTTEAEGRPWSNGATNGIQTSSLRIGRAKTGWTHASSARPRNGRFAAPIDYDEDEPEHERSQSTKSVVDETSKKATTFKAPSSIPGFTFANHSKPIQFDALVGTDAPVTSLPFSFAEPSKPDSKSDAIPSISTLAPSPVASSAFKSPQKSVLPSADSDLFASRVLNFETIPKSLEPSVQEKKATAPTVLVPAPSLEKEVAPVNSTAVATEEETKTSTPSFPIVDENSPFWDGGKEKSTTQSGLFSTSGNRF
ncbi:hypothetical protein DL96DRAFT_1070210 [Flagelloscypha sp. PMI_526]|nr:hypothetical protein DL96DRAFT_1070210 [Flagelloscypha sp. PMI_526]